MTTRPSVVSEWTKVVVELQPVRAARRHGAGRSFLMGSSLGRSCRKRGTGGDAPPYRRAGSFDQPRMEVNAIPARADQLGAAEKEVRRWPSSRILRLSQKKGGFGEIVRGARR